MIKSGYSAKISREPSTKVNLDKKAQELNGQAKQEDKSSMVQLLNYSKTTKLISGLSDSLTRNLRDQANQESNEKLYKGDRREHQTTGCRGQAGTRANTDSTNSIHHDKNLK